MRVIRPKGLVVSIPHSGTRSLVNHLGLKSHHHFPVNPDAAELFHIPIRNPMDVAAGWARRGKPAKVLIDSYALMFAFLGMAEHRLYRIEDLPNIKGEDDVGECSPSVTDAYQGRVQRLVVEPNAEFFAGFYGSGVC